MINYYLDTLKFKYADFNGRARRSEYWYFVLCNILAYLILSAVGFALGDYGGLILLGIFWLGVLIPSIAVIVRRLHDVGKSGWFYFVVLIPLVGGIWLIVLLCTDSQVGPNQYGPNPKGIGNNDNYDDQINNIGKSLS